jgi:hypothetical protein
MKFVRVRFSSRAQRRASIRRAASTLTVMAVLIANSTIECIADRCRQQAPTWTRAGLSHSPLSGPVKPWRELRSGSNRAPDLEAGSLAQKFHMRFSCGLECASASGQFGAPPDWAIEFIPASRSACAARRISERPGLNYRSGAEARSFFCPPSITIVPVLLALG